MRRLPLLLLLAVVAVLPALGAPARGQSPIAPQVLYAKQRQIFIPFEPDPAQAHRLKQLQLFYSVDQGRTWQLGASTAPDQKKFSFLAERDGFYLFAVQTTDNTGRSYPERMENATPGLRVVIDTVPPMVNLRPLPSRGNEVGIGWDIRDENLNLASPDAVRLEYRTPGNPNWLPLYCSPGAIQHYWAPGTNGTVEVKLKARDLAGNVTEAAAQLSVGGQGSVTTPNYMPSPTDNPLNVPLDPNRRFINTKQVRLAYELDAGQSGLSGIDLWLTLDGRSWHRQLSKADAVPPLVFDVSTEGVYGITLIPKSGVGISAPPPAIGEAPQLWLEIDLTKPVVTLKNVELGTGANQGKLKISWQAFDKNLVDRSITLKYSERADTWKVFDGAAGLQNTGSHDFVIPSGPLNSMPWQYYVKVEAIDKAGNVGEAVSLNQVKVDTFQPKVKNIIIQGGGF